jgi:site-specific DNA recombinase
MESEIETLKNENKELIKLLARKVITEFDYKNAVEINRNKIVELQDNIVQLKEEMNGFEQGENQRKYKKVIDDILELNDLNEELLHRVVKRIEVTEDKVINIHFRFANPFSFNGKK